MPNRIEVTGRFDSHGRPRLDFGVVFSLHALDTECHT